MRRVFLLVAAVLVAAASFLTGCMHRYFFTDPEVVKTPKGVGKKANDLQLPNDSGKQTGKPI